MTLTRLPQDSYAAVAQEDRCAPRTRLTMDATLRPSGQSGFSVVVRDLSLGGFACEAVTGMRSGQLCWVTLPGLSALQAQVVWNDGTMVGCAFENLLNQAVFDSIVAKQRG
jgi:hypothetical protein